MFTQARDDAARFAALNITKLDTLLTAVQTPAYVLDEEALRANAERLRELHMRCGVKLLLAQKAFSNYDVYPMLSEYLAGTTSSGLYEARLGAEEMPGKEVHVFCGAYRADEMDELLTYADTIVFNSIGQLKAYGPKAKAAGKEIGLRINPECSTQGETAIYDPCAPGSRLGVTRAQWDAQMDDATCALLTGLHFHTLCEQDADDLEQTVQAAEAQFGDVLPQMQWLNLGGGHHITRAGYETERLEKVCCRLRDTYQLQIYLEPGEAWALNAGYLVTQVLDRTQNGDTTNLILDMSAECHTPDVIEMPYRPPLLDPAKADAAGVTHADGNVEEQATTEDRSQNVATEKGESFASAHCLAQEAGIRPYTYRLGGPTCLAGDVIGDYSFAREVQVGERLIFGDMAIYTTVKNNTFNGMRLPSIYLLRADGSSHLLKSFGYEDFKGRLGSTN